MLAANCLGQPACQHLRPVQGQHPVVEYRRAMDSTDLLLEPLLGRVVVVDTGPPFVILGKLTRCDAQFLLLEHADVHDLRDSSTNRENYVRDCRQHGVRANRRSVLVARREVVCVSPLDEVLV